MGTTLQRTILAVAAACAAASSIVTAGAAGLTTGLAQAPQAATAAGDAARGKELVQSNGCFDCHRIARRGSHFGPDLSEIGDLRTPDRLRLALVDPDQEVAPENRFVSFITKEGAKISARLLNQDSTSVQVINQQEELKTYLRAALREYTILDKGLMPSMQGKMTDQQIADVVTYLSSLKRRREADPR